MVGVKSEDLDEILDPESLCWLAGDRTFGRGEAYAKAGAVLTSRRRDRGVEATVRGSDLYTVRLGIVNGALDYACTCPIGQDDVFCKHCVAVALVWRDEAPLAVDDEADDEGSEPSPAGPTGADIRAFLLGLDKDELVAILLDHADEDAGLLRRLTLGAAQGLGGTVVAAAWKQALSEALAIDHRASYGYSSYDDDLDEIDADFGDLCDSIAKLLAAGQAETVIDLVEHAFDEIEDALEHVDDSDGRLGDLLGDLQCHHLEACRMARPDPIALAERLFELEMESQYVAHNAVLTYADILGDSGRAAYRRLAEADWARVPVLGPGESDTDGLGRRWRIESIMEALARLDDDLEALLAVKSRNLSSPDRFLEIARLHEAAGNADQALDWAERGWRAFTIIRPSNELRGYLADLYQEHDRDDEAMVLMWDSFSENPGLHTYRDLNSRATRAGQWPSWRERALALLRAECAREKKANPGKSRTWGQTVRRDHSRLVEVFLHEGDVDAAWHEAETGGCSSGLWLNLAKRGEKSHPDQAIGVYTRHVEAILRNTGDRVYEEAVATLARIEKLRGRSGDEAAFRKLLLETRATHRRKRKLMAMLDKRGW